MRQTVGMTGSLVDGHEIHATAILHYGGVTLICALRFRGSIIYAM